MVTGGNATVFVAEMDRAIRFYTEVLGMELTSRFDNHWATVAAGGFTIGLHPKDSRYAAPGTAGATVIGLNVSESIDAVTEHLRSSDVEVVGEISRSESGNFVHLRDPDGNELYLWEMSKG